MFVGINQLARETQISRDKLKEWIDQKKIPFIRGKNGKMLFDKSLVVQFVQNLMLLEVQNGTGSLSTHETGADGQRPTGVAQVEDV